jgi:hypothetical protein
MQVYYAALDALLTKICIAKERERLGTLCLFEIRAESGGGRADALDAISSVGPFASGQITAENRGRGRLELSGSGTSYSPRPGVGASSAQ